MLPRTYEWTNVNFNADVRTFNGRLLTLQADVTCCSFYDGSAVVTRVTLIFRPSTYFEITATHEANLIDLPTGKVDIHLATADAAINFTPDMQIALQAQYDNISENFGFSARYRWEYRPGNETLRRAGTERADLQSRLHRADDPGDDPGGTDVPVLNPIKCLASKRRAAESSEAGETGGRRLATRPRSCRYGQRSAPGPLPALPRQKPISSGWHGRQQRAAPATSWDAPTQ